MNKLTGGKKRNESITLEEAKKKFHSYYDNRNKTPIGKLRGKMFDMMYQKKPKFTLEPGQPGSARYLLEEGPRTFDMKGVDYFPEDEEIVLDNPFGRDINVKSKGATYKKPEDEHINANDGDVVPHEIYGPRVRNSGRLYNKHFKELYEREWGDDEQNLVDLYWDLYRDGQIDPKTNKPYERKNKKKGKKTFIKKPLSLDLSSVDSPSSLSDTSGSVTSEQSVESPSINLPLSNNLESVSPISSVDSVESASQTPTPRESIDDAESISQMSNPRESIDDAESISQIPYPRESIDDTVTEPVSQIPSPRESIDDAESISQMSTPRESIDDTVTEPESQIPTPRESIDDAESISQMSKEPIDDAIEDDNINIVPFELNGEKLFLSENGMIFDSEEEVVENDINSSSQEMIDILLSLQYIQNLSEKGEDPLYIVNSTIFEDEDEDENEGNELDAEGHYVIAGTDYNDDGNALEIYAFNEGELYRFVIDSEDYIVDDTEGPWESLENLAEDKGVDISQIQFIN